MRRLTVLLVTLLAGSLVFTGLASAEPTTGDGAASVASAKKKAQAKKKKARQKAKRKRARAKKRREARRQRLKRPTVAITNRNASALSGGTLRVRVRAGKRQRVRLTATSTTFDAGTTQLTVPRTVKIGRKGRAVVVNLRLTDQARSAVGGCEARKLSVLARTPAKRQRRAEKDMLRNTPDCQLAPLDLSEADHCDFIAQPNQGLCMLPFPNDFYTRADSSSPTGKRLDFSSQAMPKNVDEIPIDPADYAPSDGFSQGQGIVMKVPGINTAEDVAANDFVHLSALSRYGEPDQKAVVIDAETGERWPIWVEIDATATQDPERAALLISPARNFEEKGRYIVALRNLTNAAGDQLKAPDGFRYYRDGIPSDQDQVNQRRAHFEGIFESLKKAGIKRNDLYLAWDFTVASDENNYRRVLHMRDEAFKTLGDLNMADESYQGTQAPQFTVAMPPTNNVNSNIGRRVTGTFTVPCFLTDGCGPGSSMDLDTAGLPKRNGNYEANFDCIIPPVGLNGPDPQKLRPYVFGHGLLGRANQVSGSINPDLVQGHAMIACATDEIGMASSDVGPVLSALTEMSRFKTVPDRLQQGLLNELFLARLMFHPQGLGSHSAFQDGDGTTAGESVIRTDHVYYMGASQGGIMGGPLTAISPDFIQSALVVGAMNYSTLLTRSSNWPTYGAALGNAYRDELARPLVINLAQILWDRGEPNGYAHRMTDDPPPNTPEHNVTLHVALGDHQVTNFASDVQARTVGMKTNRGAIDPQRWPDYEALWDIPRIQPNEYPYRGSAIVYWDGGPYRVNPDNPGQNIGTGIPPYPNIQPRDVNPGWEDPHGAPRGAPGAVQMIHTFFDPNGYIEDYCDDEPCRAGGWDGDFESVVVP